MKCAGGVQNCTGCAPCFLRLSVLRRHKLRLRSAKPSRLQESRSRFHWRRAQKQPTQNIVAKERVLQEVVDSDYRFGSVAVVRADSPHTLDASLAWIAGVLGLPEASAKQQKNRPFRPMPSWAG